MKIINNFFGRRKNNSRYDVMNAGSACIHTNVYLYARFS